MQRRRFIQYAAPLSAMPFFMKGFSFQAFGRASILESLISRAVNTDRVLVLVQLNGGNDGLNTVIPLDQYANLADARANILIDEAKVLKLKDSDITGFHPAMTGLRDLYSDHKLSVIQAVSYPNPNFSHFRATDIWLTAADSDKIIETGWMGRYLDKEFPNFPTGYPNSSMPDPLAIQIGAVLSPAFQGPSVGMGMSITSPTNFYNLITGTTDPVPNTPAGHELTFIRQVATQTQTYATVIKAAASKASNISSKYPTAGVNSLADQLKIVAQLIAGGLKTRIYMVNLSGFDTHAGQVAATGGNETGTHAALWNKVSTAIAAFQDDISLLKVEDKVVGMTFSEFGRRIKSNASIGTDHGAAAPVIMFGSKLIGGLYGANPTINSQVSVNDNVPMQYDFRSIYSTILKDWFEVPQSELDQVMFNKFDILPLFKVSGINEFSIDDSMLSNFPNPARNSTTLQFITSGEGLSSIKLYNINGVFIKTLAEGKFSAGPQQLTISLNQLTPGIYVCTLTTGKNNYRHKVVVE